MFDEYARSLIERLPELPGLDRDECRRTLSSAYYFVVQQQIGQEASSVEGENAEISSSLRNMVDALESVAVFDGLNEVEWSEDVKDASAFVAAEALFLSLLSTSEDDDSNLVPLLKPRIYKAIEAALLYMIGGYDINAASAVNLIENEFSNDDYTGVMTVHHRVETETSTIVVNRLKSLCSGRISQSEQSNGFSNTIDSLRSDTYEEITSVVRNRLNLLLVEGIDAYLAWLRGDGNVVLEDSLSVLRRIQTVCISDYYGGYSEFGDYYHLSSLVLSAIGRTNGRSLYHVTPAPPTTDPVFAENFRVYLHERSAGTTSLKGRPFLWPTALEYIRTCLPGPSHSAVVSMPTGSGKSFLAELATIHALSTGWVLYLAPTNALASQIRHDLSLALRPFRDISIRSFIGHEEYTTFEISDMPQAKYVSVMTPEKCLLAMRLFPEQFASCQLCVFDECHLLGEPKRGAYADIVISKLSLLSNDPRYLFMSAMLENSQDIADWISQIQSVETIPLVISWRPTRTLRGLLTVDREDIIAGHTQAKTQLLQLPPRRINLGYEAGLVLIGGLSGPWTLDSATDYRVARLPLTIQANASRRHDTPEVPSWKNNASRLLSQLFANSGLSTICFMLSSKHHAFSSAEKTLGESQRQTPVALPITVDAWLSIAEAELGVTTALRQLLINGIAVHTSAMLPSEHAASVQMFRDKLATIMFATGTLSQGLNLPAIAVVIAGTTMGDSREADANVERVASLILNGFGRAGRPGVSNQGIGVLVPDNPFFVRLDSAFDVTDILANYPILEQSDATTSIRSPLESFIDTLLSHQADLDSMTTTETEICALLASDTNEPNDAGVVLSRTFAAYRGNNQSRHLLLAQQLQQLNVGFLQQLSAPEWLERAAGKAGVSLAKAHAMFVAYQDSGILSTQQYQTFTTAEWIDKFRNVMALIPPNQVDSYYIDATQRTQTVLTRMHLEAVSLLVGRDLAGGISQWIEIWNELFELVSLHMGGATYADIAAKLFDLQPNQINGRRTTGSQHIPHVFSFLSETINRLAIDAGCFLALNEGLFADSSNPQPVPISLGTLPVCIRYGLDSVDTLFWFRFGFANRICAHALQSVFPIPSDRVTDDEKKNWVMRKKREWLSGAQHPTDSNVIVTVARNLILSGEV